MDVRLQYFDGCPNWRVLDERLSTLVDELDLTVTYEKVETVEAAQQRRFRGSPTLLVEGSDPFGDEGDAFGLSCRVYATPDGPAGSPTLQQLREALS